jgi:hypothetical protein
MTKDELREAFYNKFFEKDKNGDLILKGTPSGIAEWIADKLRDASAPPFTGAFTGMYDKNKKPIHEGDHVKLYYKGEYFTCRVVYDTKHATFFIKWPDGYVNQYFMDGHGYEVVDTN